MRVWDLENLQVMAAQPCAQSRARPYCSWPAEDGAALLCAAGPPHNDLPGGVGSLAGPTGTACSVCVALPFCSLRQYRYQAGLLCFRRSGLRRAAAS